MTNEHKVPHLILIESPHEHPFADMDIQTMIRVGMSRAPSGEAFHPVLKDETIIGRTSGCDIVLNHVTVSRRHFAIRKSGDVCTIEDLGGANGTQLNGHDLAEETVLQNGDRIKAGRCTFLFTWK